MENNLNSKCWTCNKKVLKNDKYLINCKNCSNIFHNECYFNLTNLKEKEKDSNNNLIRSIKCFQCIITTLEPFNTIQMFIIKPFLLISKLTSNDKFLYKFNLDSKEFNNINLGQNYKIDIYLVDTNKLFD